MRSLMLFVIAATLVITAPAQGDMLRTSSYNEAKELSMDQAIDGGESDERKAIQKFTFIGDYSSKWELYEIVEDSCGEIEYIRDLDGRTITNKELYLDILEEGVFAVLEYKSEKRKEDDNRIIFLVVTESKKGIKKVNLNKFKKWDEGNLMIVNHKQKDFESQKRKERN